MFEECQTKKTQQQTHTHQTGLGQLTIPPANTVIQRTTAGHGGTSQLVRDILRQVDKELIEAVIYSLIPPESFLTERVNKYIDDQLELINHLETIDQLEIMAQAGEFHIENSDRFAETVGRAVAHRIIQEERLTEARNQALLDELNHARIWHESRYQSILAAQAAPAHTDASKAQTKTTRTKTRRIPDAQTAKNTRDLSIKQAEEHFSERMKYLHEPRQEQTNSKELYRSDKYFYHATPVANLESIKRTGLDPGHGGEGGITQLTGKEREYGERCRGKIHLTDFLSTADAYAYDKVTPKDTTEKIILRFPQAFLAGTRLDIDPDEKDTAFTTSIAIPPQIIQKGRVISEETDEYGLITQRIIVWEPLLDR